MAEARLHLSGKYVAHNIGKNVVLEGFLTKLSSDGRNVELTTFDKYKVNVALSEPYSNEVSGIMQVFGTVRSKSSIAADTYVRFPPEEIGQEEFDPDDHNDFTTILYVVGYQNIAESTNIIVESANDDTNLDESNNPPSDGEMW